MSDRPTRAETVALEHVAWCRRNGMTWRQIQTSIGVMCPPTMEATVTAVALAWIHLEFNGYARKGEAA